MEKQSIIGRNERDSPYAEPLLVSVATNVLNHFLTPVPETGSVLLIGTAGILLLIRRRGRRN